MTPSLHSDHRASGSQSLRLATRADHLAAESALDLDTVREPADLARLLSGWYAVRHAVDGAVAAPTACREAADELAGPAAEAVAWLRRHLAELAGGPA